MFRPTGFADLIGRRVGIFGYGVEGRAAAQRLRGVAELVLVDDAPTDPQVLSSKTGGLDALAACEVILKSPGIPRRRADVLALEARGVYVTSALNLWLGDAPRERVIAVTGTKGKSTTTTLIAFFLESLGHRAVRVGNIGAPPYDPSVDATEGWWVLEVSSFQSADVTHAPAFIVVTSLGSDHLDWHGSLEQYHRDKLALTRATGEHVTVLADSQALRAEVDQLGGTLVWVREHDHALAEALHLLGTHNDANVGLALAVVARVTNTSTSEVRAAALARVSAYVPLAGRLSIVRDVVRDADEFRFIDDGLATAPLPTLAALEVFADDPLALVAGGFDRGVDYHELATTLNSRERETHVVTMGPAGERLASLLAPHVKSGHVDTVSDAVALALTLLEHGGVVLFSPAARVSTATATGKNVPAILCARWTTRPANGAWEEIRTPDLRITNALLYRLSYPGAERKISRPPAHTPRSQFDQAKHQVVQEQCLVEV